MEENGYSHLPNEGSEQNIPVDSQLRPALPRTVQQLMRTMMPNWGDSRTNHRNNRQESPSEGTSTEVPSGIDSENEDSESFHSFLPEPLTDESQSGSSVENTPQPAAPRDSGIIF